MNRKQRRTIEKIIEKPTRSDIKWPEVESLLLSLGATTSEGSGSRINIELNGHDITIHKPHPRPEIKKYIIDYLRDFLKRQVYDANPNL